jgi:A/G-specific adenine glycosylase
LMDLGVALKSHVKGIHHRSRHHVRQSRFEGSKRQVRAAILRLLTNRESIREEDVSKLLTYDPAMIHDACRALLTDGLLTARRGRLMIVR